MQVTQEIQLDINGNPNRTFLCKQADDNSRYLKITLMDGTTPLSVPNGTTVTLRALKPDGTQVYNAGTRNSDGTITVELDAQVLAVEGLVRADVSTAYSGQILSSANFCIRVEPVPMGSGITSTSEFLQLTELIEDASQYQTSIAELREDVDTRTAYATCSTGASTAAKVATISGTSTFVLETGSRIAVKFTNSNTAANPTLNVNSTGAKSIKRYGTTADGTNSMYSWTAGQVIEFVYDGTNWLQMTAPSHEADLDMRVYFDSEGYLCFKDYNTHE